MGSAAISTATSSPEPATCAAGASTEKIETPIAVPAPSITTPVRPTPPASRAAPPAGSGGGGGAHRAPRRGGATARHSTSSVAPSARPSAPKALRAGSRSGLK